MHATLAARADFSWGNPSYVSLGFTKLHLDIYHACCTAPITSVDDDISITVPPRSSSDFSVTVNLDSSQLPGASQCASELVTQSRCLLTFKGYVQPIYTGYELPTIPVQFQQYITR